MSPVSEGQIELILRLANQLNIPTPVPRTGEDATAIITKLRGMRR